MFRKILETSHSCIHSCLCTDHGSRHALGAATGHWYQGPSLEKIRSQGGGEITSHCISLPELPPQEIGIAFSRSGAREGETERKKTFPTNS